MKWRIPLAIAALIFAALYSIVILVALVTSGADLLRQPLAYYAAIMPVLYCAFCLLTVAGRIPTPWLRSVGVAVHLATLPCVVMSFLGMGLVLPLVAVLWYQVYRGQRAAEAGPLSR